jgi:hypothetical protein
LLLGLGAKLGELSGDQVLDIDLIVSGSISWVLLSSIYQRGRDERLHGPMVILAFVVSVVLYNVTVVPADVLVFGVFPWVIAAALFLSRICDPFLVQMEVSGAPLEPGNRITSSLSEENVFSHLNTVSSGNSEEFAFLIGTQIKETPCKRSSYKKSIWSSERNCSADTLVEDRIFGRESI